MTIATKRLALAALTATLTATVVSAMMPWPRESIADVEDGKAAPFVGNWSMVLAGQPDTTYATCELPVRIEAANETHIFYVGPKDPEPEAATELVSRNGRTAWLPIAARVRSPSERVLRARGSGSGRTGAAVTLTS